MTNSTLTPAQKQLINSFLTLNISVEDFNRTFEERYDYFYDNNDPYSYNDIVLFDNMLKAHKSAIYQYITKIANYRQDIFTSDRECAAFVSAMRIFVSNSISQKPAPLAVSPELIEKYCGAGCTFGNINKTKYIQRVNVVSPWGNIIFLYHGTRAGAFSEIKKQFPGFVKDWSLGNTLYLYFAAAEDNIEGAEIDRAEVVARCEQLDAERLTASVIAWHIRLTAFAPLPLALPAIGTPDTTPAAQTIAKPYPPRHTAANFKTKYPEHIILYRVGDFYEAFDDDARTIAKITGLTLINKTDTDGTRFSLVGFPFHQIDSYLPRLVRHGHKVAICDELTAPTPTSQKATTPTAKNTNMLQDWGEKIGGARKDEATNHNPAPVPTKKLKYGLTFTVTSSSNELLWHIKTSPRRYSLCAFVRYGDKSAIYQGKVNEYIEEAERLLIEKYPNFENLYNFDIYHIPIKGYVIRAKRVKIDIATLPTREEATAFLLSEKPQIYLQVAKANRPTEQKNRAAALVVRNSINRPRLGTDYAQGRNITPEELATTFGLRAVEFGNWMTADDRQTSINECYSSFRALAEILQIERNQIGRGTLAVAFGARGTGKANAHYEPTRHVINLTRTRGAGSLAHEWAHSIDFDGTLQKKLSRNFWFKGYSLRSKSAGSYWGKEEEQFARAFETAIHYELKGREVIDDYLVNIIEDCPVYPTASENERIAAYVIEKIKSAL